MLGTLRGFNDLLFMIKSLKVVIAIAVIIKMPSYESDCLIVNAQRNNEKKERKKRKVGKQNRSREGLPIEKHCQQ